MPYFRWDKSVLDNGVRSDNAYNLPPGPNNPVGIVWMAINRPSVGMHGTPNPTRSGGTKAMAASECRTGMHLSSASLIEKGTPVDVK